MKMISGLLIGIVVLIITVILIACKTKSNKTNTAQNKKSEKTVLADNPYNGLRTQAINTSAEELDLTTLNDKEIFGIIMDWNMENAIITVTSFRTGDASIYMSTGQMFIGGIGHETITNAAKKFVALGDKYLSKAKKTDTTDPVIGNKVDFYFLTTSGKYLLEEEFSNIKNNKSGLIDLFNSANQVITEYRLITEKK